MVNDTFNFPLPPEQRGRIDATEFTHDSQLDLHKAGENVISLEAARLAREARVVAGTPKDLGTHEVVISIEQRIGGITSSVVELRNQLTDESLLGETG